MSYTASEAAKTAGVSESTICEALKNGDLRGTKHGRHWQIDESDLERYMYNRGIDCICKTCLAHYKRNRQWDHDVCRACYPFQNITASRPLTKDTLYLIAVYAHRGDSLEEIAFELRRPADEIARLLADMQKDGTYSRHVSQYEDYQQYGLVR